MNKREIASISIVVLLLWIFIRWTNPFEILDFNFNLNYKYILYSSAFSTTAHSLMAYRYWIVLRENNTSYYFRESLHIHFITPILARVTPMNLGETRKLISHNLQFEEASFVHLNERMLDFTIILISSLGIFIISNIFDKFIFSLLFLILISLIVFLMIWKLDKIISIFNRYSPYKINMRKNWYAHFYYKYSWKSKMRFIMLSVLIWISSTLVFFNLSRAVTMEIPYYLISILMATVIILYSIAGLPGGYGVRELSLTFLLTQFNIPLIVATAYTLLYAAYVIIIESIFALISFLFGN